MEKIDPQQVESAAQDHIASILARHNMLVAIPKFDKKGADLLILYGYETSKTAILRVQSKGRTFGEDGRARVEIPKRYVTENFVLFCCFVDPSSIKTLVFFNDDLEKYPEKDGKIEISFYQKTIQDYALLEFSTLKADRIKEILRRIDSAKEIQMVLQSEFEPPHVEFGEGDTIYQQELNNNAQLFVQKDKRFGTLVSWIVDNVGHSRVGASPPSDDMESMIYNESTNVWITKIKNSR